MKELKFFSNTSRQSRAYRIQRYKKEYHMETSRRQRGTLERIDRNVYDLRI